MRNLLEDASDRCDPRSLANNPLSGAAADTTHLATPRGADNVLSGAPVPGSASTLGMFSTMFTGLESAKIPGPSSATVDSEAARVPEFNSGIWSGHAMDAHQGEHGIFLDDTLTPKRAYP